ncbi:MAG TPA: outer membrane lipoprotein carrier protein LolA [Bryobacteraceae bacterium]|jgi:outer membrane lipoprotein-sorting protein|nr:outer membrane lipoprotein carrier protein LolA [Bryobacteraceae bacterium]
MATKGGIRWVSVCIAAAAFAGRAPGDALSDVLSRMDKSAQTFESMSANITQLTHTAVIDENDQQSGSVRLKRASGGVLGFVQFTSPQPLVVAFRNRKVEKYYPKTNVVEEYDVDKYGEQLDQFILLGFGASGKDLQKNYRIRLVDAEPLAGKPATHIELIPKSKEALEYLKRAELWIPDDAAYPLQEKLWKNADDYVLINYSNVKLNPPLTDKDFELRLPPGVKRITPGK